MNVNQETMKPFLEMIDTHLTKQLSIAFLVWALISLIILTAIVKKFTSWPILVSITVTIVTTIFIVPFVYIPFGIIDYLITKSNIYTTLKTQSRNVQLLFVIPLLLWKILAIAITYLWSFKIIAYFDKKRTYDFGRNFFLYLFVACSITFLFPLLHALIYLYAL